LLTYTTLALISSYMGDILRKWKFKINYVIRINKEYILNILLHTDDQVIIQNNANYFQIYINEMGTGS
jgi:hypothetical protein